MGLLRVMAESELQASTDNLTGLLNRRSFEQRLANVRRHDTPVTLAMGDLDNFKTLNDTFGHETGDRALRLFGRVLTESVRGQDIVSRHGGEEFLVALLSCATEPARVIFDTIRLRLDAAITVVGLPKFTVSFGLVEADRSESIPTMIGRAKAALFTAKRDGRDRVVVHDGTGVTVAPGSALGETLSLEAAQFISERVTPSE
jgi:diguanylate cyclase (GGDEF)-like protein